MNEKLFNGKTEYYEQSRPSVSQEAIDYLFSLIPSGAVFADIGAGTGKFTSLIAERGNTIFAIEPNNDMHRVLSKKLYGFSNVTIFNTSAEATGIPSKSVDVVVTVTALHWFDLEKFRKECLRILKPNGIVFVIYNSQKDELRKVSMTPSNNTATEKFFNGKYVSVEFPNPMLYPGEKFIAYHLSHTAAPKPEDECYTTYLKGILEQFDRNSTNDRYLFDFVSVLYYDTDFFRHYSDEV